MVIYLYSVNIQNENSNIAFLKASPKLIQIEGKVLEKGKTATILTNQGVETISFLKRIERRSFGEIYWALKKATIEYGLSCEYIKNGNVCLLAKNQLRSQEKIEEKIEHRVVRRKKYKHKDLILRKAEKRDYGDYCEVSIWDVFRGSVSWQMRLRKEIEKKGIQGFLVVVNEFDGWRREEELWVNKVRDGKVRTIGRVRVVDWREAEKLWRKGELSMREERELRALWEMVEQVLGI